MALVLLVSEQRLKEYTNIDENVRVSELTPLILQAQDIYIQDKTGTALYERLKSGVVAGDLSTIEVTLLNDYIAPALMQYSLYLFLPGMKYKLTEKGILSGSSEEADGISLDELEFLMQRTLDKAEFYTARLIDYLKANASAYSEYLSCDNGDMSANTTSYFSGLYIPR